MQGALLTCVNLSGSQRCMHDTMSMAERRALVDHDIFYSAGREFCNSFDSTVRPIPGASIVQL
jgi:hypothetical protein